MINNQNNKTKNKKLLNNIKKILVVLIVVLVMIKLNKAIFFVGLFSIFAFLGKQIRGMYGLKLVVLDPLLFCAIMIGQFLGLKWVVIYIGLNTLIVDFVTNIASEGTFANFFLYSGSVALGVGLLGSLNNMMIYGNIASLSYSLTYYLFRTYVIPKSPMETIPKIVTSFVFTFLYMTFFGPLFKLLMTM